MNPVCFNKSENGAGITKTIHPVTDLHPPDCVVKVAEREFRNSRLAFGVSVTVYVVSGRRPISLAELASPGRVIFLKGSKPVPGLVPDPPPPPVPPVRMGPNWIS